MESYTQILNQYNIKYLFHMTHIDNLASILSHGLYSHNNQYQKIDISDNQVNSRRQKAEPIYHQSIHSYVPFYFNPKNNMLSRRRSIQDDIVILVLGRKLFSKENVLFTDGNASSDATQFYNKKEDLNKVNFTCVQTKGYYNSFEDGGRKRMAEVLVPHHVEATYIKGIICNNPTTKEKIDKISQGNYKSVLNTSYFF
jgi:hypothetical protein